MRGALTRCPVAPQRAIRTAAVSSVALIFYGLFSAPGEWSLAGIGGLAGGFVSLPLMLKLQACEQQYHGYKCSGCS